MLVLCLAACLLPARAGDVVLEDGALRIGFDSESGALTRLEAKATGWKVERRPEMGVSFRLHAPLPGRRDNFVLGARQRAVEVARLPGNRVRLVWRSLASEHGGTLAMTLTALVTLQDGALRFDTCLENDSPLTVESIEYPYFGDLAPPTRAASLHVCSVGYRGLESDEIYPAFSNEPGYWGVDYPTKIIGARIFCLIQGPDQGLYVERHNPDAPYLLRYTLEQRPGLLESMGNRVPAANEISGIPVHLEFRATHYIFAHPHSKLDLMPVVLRSYRGDWHAGVDCYKQWRATWFQRPRLPRWVADVNSWQQLQIDSPEQDYRVPYSRLVDYGRECAKAGVAAIQLVGWNRGGQDGGDPSQETDPGLGTWQELHDAIAQIQAMGVKVILFGKLNWADLTSATSADLVRRYAATDPYGIPYQHGGYNYYTPTQLAGINPHRRAVMDFASPAYRELAAKEFHKLLDLGAAGWLYDEVNHHEPVNYSFAPDHGYAPPGYIYAGDIPMARRLRAEADKVDPDFFFAGEAPQDWLMQYYGLSYYRIRAGSVPVARYIDPKAPLMIAVTGWDDREILNIILMDRFIASYEPYYFKGHLSDFPLTVAYGRKIDALRRRYRSFLWDGEFRDTLGAEVRAHGPCHYSVFDAASGKRAVVIANGAFDKALAVTVLLPNPGRLVVATPEQPDAQPTTGELEIPPRSAAVVMER